VQSGDVVGLQDSNGTWVSAQNGGGGTVFAYGASMGPWEGFVFEIGAPKVVASDTQLQGKMLFGYQGWFACPGDGSRVDRWQHWSDTPPSQFDVDMWPDISEFSASELFAIPGVTKPDGTNAYAFSAFPSATVMRHFQWMQQYGLDGALLQRFLAEVQDPVYFDFRNQVTSNVRSAAEALNRLWALEYDLSSVPDASAVAWFQKDWMYMVDTLHVLESPRYVQYGSKPALLVWGFGFSFGGVSTQTAAQLIAWLQTGAPPQYRVAVIGGIPSHWRTLDQDAATDPAWAGVFRSFDAVSPWSVGRFSDEAGADNYRATVTEPDLAELTPLGVGYLPVVFPGFSWHNLKGGPLNQIPRNGGSLYWRQVYNALSAGATMLKTAMFDEMNEGTAMFKLAPTQADVPAQARFVSLDADGQQLRSDHYLSVGGAATQTVHGASPLTPTLPQLP
jgi:hypothetical protein